MAETMGEYLHLDPSFARLVNGNEVTALDLDCSGTDGDGDVKLASTNLYLGGDARMVSAILG